jgi:hypothetical protein
MMMRNCDIFFKKEKPLRMCGEVLCVFCIHDKDPIRKER